MTDPTTIGPYRVEREIARGGMGVVYLARDERLQRAVALKAIAADLVADDSMRARFEREARLLASINHPNIASIYGLEESAGARYLVMEFVEGRTLADMLRTGPLHVDEALSICAGIAAAVEAAHESGVIHRDLKPGNVIVTPQGVPKVLDFGLAKGAPDEPSAVRRTTPAASPAPGTQPKGTGPSTPASEQSADSPTMSFAPTARARSIEPPPGSHETIPGRVLGTAGYMSPEQARGRAVDRRTDVWALGCVLFECLAGKSPFAGATVSDSIAAIIEREPEWALLPANTPPRIRELLDRCLQKDAAKRLRDAGDARLEIERAIAGREWSASFIAASSSVRLPQTTHAGRGASWSFAAAAILLGLALGAAAAWLALRPQPTARPLTRLAVPIPPGIIGSFPELSADGSLMIFQGIDEDAALAQTSRRIFLRRFDEAEPAPIPGTERAGGFSLSPDGRWIAYVTGLGNDTMRARIMKQPIDASAPPALVGVQPDEREFGSIEWLETGEIISLTGFPPRIRVFPSSGGDLIRDVEVKIGQEPSDLFRPSLLPGGQYILAEWARYKQRAYTSSCVAINLQTGDLKVLIDDAASPRWSATGHIVFARLDTLLAVRFDPKSLSVTGSPFTLGNGVRRSGGGQSGTFSLSNNGLLAYAPGADFGWNRRVMVFKEGEDPAPLVDERRGFESFNVVPSPDGSMVAATIANQANIYELWLWEHAAAQFQRLVQAPGADCMPMGWIEGGKTLVYTRRGGADGQDGVYAVTPGDASPPRLLLPMFDPYVFIGITSSSPDGRWLWGFGTSDTGSDIFRIDLTSSDPKPEVVIPGEPRNNVPSLSPDGKVLAYAVEKGLTADVIVRTVQDDGKLGPPVNVGQSESVVFWRTAKPPALAELVYMGRPNEIWATEIFTEPRLRAGTSRKIGQLAPGSIYNMPTTIADGRVFYIERGEDEKPPTHFALTQNFDQELLRQERRASSTTP